VRPALVAVAAFLLLFVALAVRRPTNVGADTLQLYRGAAVALRCLEDGTFRNCGRSPQELAASEQQYPLRSAVGPFAFLQYPPAILMIKAGLSERHTLRGLALLSLAAYLALLGLLAYAGRRWGAGLVLVAVGGPLLFYATSTLAESLSAVLIVLATVAVLRRWHAAWIGVTAWLAAITKETAAPFVLAIGLIALLGIGSRPRSRGAYAGLVAGCLAGAVTGALFNVFRYGTVLNEDELGAVWGESYGGNILPLSLGQRLLHFAGLLVAPNGGLLFFWPLAVAVLLLALRRSWRGLAIWATLLVLTAGFASYFNPFGWFAWGPRLLLPWIPALALLAVAALGPALPRPRLRTAAAGALVVAVVSLPHVGAVSAPATVE
jgi:hypothetical protein